MSCFSTRGRGDRTFGETLSVAGYIGLGVALVAVVLVGFVPDKRAVRPSAKGLSMAVGSGLMIGTFMVMLDATPHDSGAVPVLLNRAADTLVIVAAIAVLALFAV